VSPTPPLAVTSLSLSVSSSTLFNATPAALSINAVNRVWALVFSCCRGAGRASVAVGSATPREDPVPQTGLGVGVSGPFGGVDDEDPDLLRSRVGASVIASRAPRSPASG